MIFLKPLEKFDVYTGRSSRSEYWGFWLFTLLIVTTVEFLTLESELIWLNLIIGLLLYIPLVCVNIRRLHDINKSGWWFLLWFIPLIGTIWIIVLLCRKGDEGKNRFGNNPLKN
jgi:uncharacterized membrane protein YhaH (DUF805 family)